MMMPPSDSVVCTDYLVKVTRNRVVIVVPNTVDMVWPCELTIPRINESILIDRAVRGEYKKIVHKVQDVQYELFDTGIIEIKVYATPTKSKRKLP